MDEELVLSVAYEGDAGVQQFVKALEPLPGQVSAIMDRLGGDGVTAGGLNADTGRKLARAVFDGWQSEMAGFSFFSGEQGARSVLDAAGLSAKELQRAQVDLRKLRELLNSLKTGGLAEGQYGKEKAYNQATFLGLKDLQLDSKAADRHMQSLTTRAKALTEQLKVLRQREDALQGKYYNGADSSAPDFSFNDKAVELARLSGATLTRRDVVRDANGMPDIRATNKMFENVVEGALGQISMQAKSVQDQYDFFKRAPIFSDNLEAAGRKLTEPGGALRAQAEEAYYREAATEVRERRAGVNRNAKVSPSWAAHIANSEVPILGATRTEKQQVEGLHQERLGTKEFAASVERLRQSQEGLELALRELSKATQLAAADDSRMLYRQIRGDRNVAGVDVQGPSSPLSMAGPQGFWKTLPVATDALREAAGEFRYLDERQDQRRDTNRRARAGAEFRESEGRPVQNASARPGRSPYGTWLDPDKLNLGPTRNWQLEALKAEMLAEGSQRFGGAKGPSFRESFMTGFTGPQDAPFGEMAGQTARIALFYGAAYRGLAMLQQAIADVAAEAIDYQAALTEVSVATNRSREEVTGLATDLGSVSASAGFGATEGVRLGAQTVGLWGLAGASLEEQKSTSLRTAEVATQMARVSPGADLTDTATQLVGTARAFNMGVEQLTRIQDSTVYMSRNTGQNPQQLLGAASNVATLGISAGFSLEEIMAIIAQVGTTTGQNPEGTAGQFRQVLSREFEPVARRAEQIFDIDTSDLSTVRDVLDRIASGPVTQEQLNQFSTIFGKGGSQSVAMITMQNWGRIQGLSDGASSAQGIGQETFELAMQDIGQSLRVMGAEWMELGLLLTQTGILDWLALVVEGATTVAEVLQLVVGAFNEIPRPIRAIALAAAEFMAVAAFLRSGTGVGMLAALGGGANRVNSVIQGAPGFAAKMFPTVARGVEWAKPRAGEALTSGRGFFEGLLAASTSRVQGSALARRGASGLASLGGGSVAVGALGVAGGAVVAVDQFTRYLDAASAGANALAEAASLAATAITPDDYRAAAGKAREGAADARGATIHGLQSGDVANLLPSLFATWFGGNGDRAADLDAKASEYDAMASAIEDRQRARLSTDPSSIFDDFSTEGLSTSLQALEDQGYSAAQRVDLMTAALIRYSNATEQGGDFTFPRIQRDEVAGTVAGSVTGLFERERDRLESNRQVKKNSFVMFGDQLTLEDQMNIQGVEAVDTEAIQNRVREVLLERLGAYGDQVALSESDISSLANLALAGVEQGGGDAYANMPEESKKVIQNAIRGRVLSALAPYSAETITKDLGGYLNDLLSNGEVVRDDALLSGRSGVEAAGSQVDYLEGQISMLQGLQSQGLMSDEDARLFEFTKRLVLQKKRELVAMRIAEIDRLAQVALGGVAEDNITEQLRIKSQAADAKYSEAAQAYGQSMTLNDHGVPQFDSGLGEQLSNASNDKFQQQQAQAKNSLAILQAQMQNVSPGNGLGQAMAEYNSVMAAINSGIYTPGEAQMAQLQAQATAAAFNVRSTSVQGQNANALANIDPRANTARISQQIANARREMGLYAYSDPRYGQLRDQINQLQVQYVEAIASRANALASANIAGHTSSLESAQVNVANAQRSLGTQLKGTEGYYNALAALRRAKVELAAEERAQADRQRRLGSDLTDPVEQARLDVKQAQSELKAAQKRGDGPDVIDQAKLDLRSAQNAEEQAAFSQRLSDIQTAEELGRISHSAYMDYLRSEHDRLSAISDRTRQQQEQLDQVDKLMKTAAEQLNGQFNIGDIDLPTVYDVRRAMGSGAATGVNDYSHSGNTITINGADFGQVVAYIEQFMGGASFGVTSAGRKA